MDFEQSTNLKKYENLLAEELTALGCISDFQWIVREHSQHSQHRAIFDQILTDLSVYVELPKNNGTRTREGEEKWLGEFVIYWCQLQQSGKRMSPDHMQGMEAISVFQRIVRG